MAGSDRIVFHLTFATNVVPPGVTVELEDGRRIEGPVILRGPVTYEVIEEAGGDGG
jgi:hypothetical protein